MMKANLIARQLRNIGQECFDDYKLITRKIDERVWDAVCGELTVTAFRSEILLQFMLDFGEDWS